MVRRAAQKVARFLSTDIWRIRAKELSRSRSYLLRLLRIIVLSFRGFLRDDCFLRASALTFYSVLSIVPVLAAMFGIAKGLGLEDRLQEELLLQFRGQEEAVNAMFGFAKGLLEKTRGGAMAGVGLAVLFYAVLKMLSYIESSFNHIWGIKRARPLRRRIVDFTAMMFICPFLLVLSGALTVVVAEEVRFVMNRITFLGPLSSVVFVVLAVLPYCAVWVLFAFLYIFVPNTRVNLGSGILAGILAGTMYQLLQRLYIFTQVGVARYSAIYGSFAALPLFMVWLQISWLIMLFGAEFAFAHQNVETYEFEPDCLTVSGAFKRLLALRIANLLCKNFASGRGPLTGAEIAHELDMPVRLANQILYELTACGVLCEAAADDAEQAAYQPGRDINVLTVKYVIEALERAGSDAVPVARSEELRKLSECLRAFEEAVEQSPGNVLLKDI